MSTQISTVNIYRHQGVWCYAAWTEEGFDHSDTLGCDDNASETDAQSEAESQFHSAKIRRVEDAA